MTQPVFIEFHRRKPFNVIDSEGSQYDIDYSKQYKQLIYHDCGSHDLAEPIVIYPATSHGHTSYWAAPGVAVVIDTTYGDAPVRHFSRSRYAAESLFDDSISADDNGGVMYCTKCKDYVLGDECCNHIWFCECCEQFSMPDERCPHTAEFDDCDE